MGIILAIANCKGGSGKSALCANCAAALMQEGRRVRMVDMDTQASVTQTILGAGRPARGGIGDVLTGAARALVDTAAGGAAPGWAPYPVAARLDGWLDLLAADDVLARWAREYGGAPVALVEPAARLRAAAVGVDILLVDTPGAVGPELGVALLAADLVLSPVGVGSSVDLDPLGDLRAARRALWAAGLYPASVGGLLVPSDYREREAAQRDGLAALRAEFGGNVFAPIPHSALIARAINEGCVRTGTIGIGDGCRGWREPSPAADQAAASSAMRAAHRSCNNRRRSASEIRSPHRVVARKYWRCSSKAGQKRAAEAKLPKPRMG